MPTERAHVRRRRLLYSYYPPCLLDLERQPQEISQAQDTRGRLKIARHGDDGISHPCVVTQHAGDMVHHWGNLHGALDNRLDSAFAPKLVAAQAVIMRKRRGAQITLLKRGLPDCEGELRASQPAIDSLAGEWIEVACGVAHKQQSCVG